MMHAAIITRTPIIERDFRPIADVTLGKLGYTVNMEGEVRDKAGHTLHRVFLPHLPGAIVQVDRQAYLCCRLVEATFYPNALWSR